MPIKTHQHCNDCGSSDALAEYASNTYCFSCHMSHPTEKPLISPILEREFRGVLPYQATRDLSAASRIWLKSVGILEDTWQYFNIHDLRGQFAVLPLYSSSFLCGYELKPHLNPQLKYKTIGRKLPQINIKNIQNCTITVVEDLRSSMKLWQSGVNSVALLGTSISKNFCNKLAREYKKVNIWLDGDQPGKIAANIIYDKLALVTDVKIIKTYSDPKYHCEEEIREKLS